MRRRDVTRTHIGHVCVAYGSKYNFIKTNISKSFHKDYYDFDLCVEEKKFKLLEPIVSSTSTHYVAHIPFERKY